MKEMINYRHMEHGSISFKLWHEELRESYYVCFAKEKNMWKSAFLALLVCIYAEGQSPKDVILGNGQQKQADKRGTTYFQS